MKIREYRQVEAYNPPGNSSRRSRRTSHNLTAYLEIRRAPGRIRTAAPLEAEAMPRES
jgi:hypothetical protein